MQDLQRKRDELQKKYERMKDDHSKKGNISNEGAHMDSAMALKAIYYEIYELSLKIGDPVPLWF
tara:strand:- start:182 stop:373 length:192 start_codon:yes stop_codon:yes gene_type:complete